EEAEVSGYRNIPEVGTNRVRGGMALVIAEGIALKAPKLKKLVADLGIDGWEWLDTLISKGEDKKEEEGEEHEEDKSKEGKPVVKPVDKYLKDIVAGRPVFSHPSRKGGFRLRYGRARNSGFATVGVNPATMIIVSSFIAVGCQLKIERPGKAGGVVPVTSIEGPTVRLTNGDVLKVNTANEARTYLDQIEKILDMGEMLINYGEFVENNHPLIPSSYVYEWWFQEAQLQGDYTSISEDEALKLCDEGVPLHPDYTYLWHDITAEEIKYLREFIAGYGKVEGKYGKSTLVAESDPEAKEILEKLLVEHKVREGMLVMGRWKVLVRCLGLNYDLKEVTSLNGESDPLKLVANLSGLKIRAKAPTRIGARMGRPEKARERKMSPPPHVLFPVGYTGGKTRDIKKSINYTSSHNAVRGEYLTDLPIRVCQSCGKETLWAKCDCGGIAEQQYYCNSCRTGTHETICPQCGRETYGYRKRKMNIREVYESALNNLELRDTPSTIKGVVGLTSKNKVAERMEKGLLRAIHSVYVFKDGTIRYDMTDLPVTHFRPSEIGVTVEKLKEMGYGVDWKGQELKNDGQVVELKPQDIILAKSGAQYFLNAANFIDDLLEKYYGMERFYNAEKEEDLIGHLVIGLAPHTSAGVLGRIIGFSDVTAGYAHPYFHASKRRNCFSSHETLPIYDGDKWRIVKIGDFVEELLKEGNYEVTDFGDVVVKGNGYHTISYVDGEWKVMKVSAFSKHPSPNHMVKIRGKDGRILRTTGDHPFPQNNGSCKINASGVKELLSPSKLNIPEKDIDCIDILSLDIEDLMIKGISGYFSDQIRENGGFEACARQLGVPKSTLWNYTKRDSVPKEILDKLDIAIPEEAYVSVKRDTVVLPRFLKVDKEFLQLVGYYVAEGYARKGERFYQVSIATGTNRKLIRELIKETLQVTPIEGEEALISSRIVFELFTNLGLGRSAREKRIPPSFLSLPLEKLKYLLQGYFSGDGSVSRSSTLEVSCTSTNIMLLKDIEFILTRFGIRVSWYNDSRTVDSGTVAEFYSPKGETVQNISHKLRIYGKDAKKFCQEIGFLCEKQEKARKLSEEWNERQGRYEISDNCRNIKVDSIEFMENDDPVYNLTVDSHNVLMSNSFVYQCDGDEDCVMLLFDGLLNFSMDYLPDKRGGRMDAPLVLTAIIDPREVDHEVHNMDIEEKYPLEFYEATLNYKNPKDLTDLIETVADKLPTETRYYGLRFTHDTEDIAAGVKMSAYKSLTKMSDKVHAQMSLAEKIVAVDEHNVAERVINTHFLPDIIGNLRAFSRQEFRCVKCDQKYRKMPLQGKCVKCNGKLTLSVHGGSIRKYLDLSRELVEKYEVKEYTRQRLKLIDLEIQSLFESETRRQIKISEFFG
ncbi:MAG: DNA polymerase II large subunit, partial [Candidatus Hadarchaeota archaeon]